MRSEQVEIFSDQTNAAVMRHPGRRFPGLLIQGDTLAGLCRIADEACREVGRGAPGFAEVNEIRNALRGLLDHYKRTLDEHGMPLPFSE
ncbi:hypothetical protein [Sphingomonas sp.]|uniref:DUF6959 family protein n=1 Tax=Sphingomonas sp. TaxID=28214 RepID=UPI0025F94A71|nr:hypothetical protein [Sphingomonas sp.]